MLYSFYGINKIKRVFKTAGFSKAAQKSGITDIELCEAIKQVFLGQAVDLGGGVFKKRLNENKHRSIILAKGGNYWIYQYLFAKKNTDNISNVELINFKLLAKAYSGLSETQVKQLQKNKEFLEICNEHEI